MCFSISSRAHAPFSVTDCVAALSSTGKRGLAWKRVDVGGEGDAWAIVLSIICDTWKYIQDSNFETCLVMRCDGITTRHTS